MLAVSSPPLVEPAPHGGWEITFWLGEAFDFSIPFRASVAEIAGLLGEDPARALTMAPFADGEDFVEGRLRFGRYTVGVYYEYSLGYLTLSHQAREPLDVIAGKVRSAVRLL